MQKMARTNIRWTRRNARPHSKEYAQIETWCRIPGPFSVCFKKNPEHSLHRFSKPGILNTFVTVERNLITGYLEWPHRCATFRTEIDLHRKISFTIHERPPR